MQKKLSEQNQKIIGILTIYSCSSIHHESSGLCYYFSPSFRAMLDLDSYEFFKMFVKSYLVNYPGYCKERQILVDMIIDLILEFNPTLKRNKEGDLTLSCRKKGFKEAFKMVRYYGGYR